MSEDDDPVEDVDDVAEVVDVDGSPTVKDVLTVRAVESGAVPLSSRVWDPSSVVAGMVRFPVTVPDASAVRVPSVTGSECRTAVTSEPGLQSAELTATVPPGSTVAGVTVIAPATTVVLVLVVEEPSPVVDVVDELSVVVEVVAWVVAVVAVVEVAPTVVDVVEDVGDDPA